MSRRASTRRAVNGMVSSDDHLATAAGVAMLIAGGSAADAAIAANAVLTVTAPHACGLGGDLFALVHDGGIAPSALMAAGRAGSGADAEQLRASGVPSMPLRGDIRSVTVPGCVDGWMTLHRRFGRLDLTAVLAPAVRLAAGGFPPSPELTAASVLLVDGAGDEDLLDGQGRPRRGLVRRPGVARLLEVIGRDGRRGFYAGEFGAALVELAAGELTEADVQRDHADWVDPISTRAWGAELWGPPPVSQAYVGLSAWWMTEGLPLPDDPDEPGWPHLLAEALRQSALDRRDVLHEGADPADLLSGARLGARRGNISPDRAAATADRPGAGGSTTYLAAVDADGTAVSLIQSNASAFGSHLAVPGTGVFLQNRGIGFSLERGHPAEYGPGRRPPHTLSPFLVTDDRGELGAVLGTRGADAQPQVVLQILTRIAAGASPGAALSAPRFVIASPDGTGFDTWTSGRPGVLKLEVDAPAAWRSGLASLGHEVVVAQPRDPSFGSAHVITADDGVLTGAADPRASVGAASGC